MYYDRPKKRSEKKAAKKPGRPARVPSRPARRPKSARSVKKRAPAGRSSRVVSAPRRKRHLLLKGFVALILLVLLGAAGLYFLPVASLGSQKAPGAFQSLPKGYTHVLLIGLDTNSYDTSRSDTMVVLSVGKGRALLTSLQRDTGVKIEGRTGLHRLNAAYNYGGADTLLETVNRNFGLDLSLYMLVDYESFPELIDLIGGVDIESVTDAEIEPLNHNVRDVLRRRYDKGELTWDEITLMYLREELTKGGNLHLDGLQALGYARIRKTDSDYMRTLRQRKILTAALKSLKKSGPVSLVRFAAKSLNVIETNMNLFQLLSLGEKALLASEIEQMRLPVSGTFKDDGGMFYDVDYRKNYEAFLRFVYGE